ncbi:fibronectin-binding A domain protein, related [Neospora caninum Liverpool]|uniref:Fibronectin-binding A domain protein, related n=1 Tax=Neospora caninum (strain Liverpool) TaxID=572307 RepID=F0V8S9_NEOCL|nr:fibronectin-binding A domain protein, related [Neospora caninum Liverpool]CBZ50120.1 fibronectin-binding A domain protein, related [Neospora caninum Liverpool]CEL64714.1 TPA: Fibronectin-binding A domain protein, related [Neospora caninum Liverpool]|eukprot:XP_003880155.1 fibronectin-binding A domain protein, related [Neospora caninum Liverpool]
MRDRHGALITFMSIVITIIMKLNFVNAYAMPDHRPLLLKTAKFLFPCDFGTRYTPAWQGTPLSSGASLRGAVSTALKARRHQKYCYSSEVFLFRAGLHGASNKPWRHSPRSSSILQSQLTAPTVGLRRAGSWSSFLGHPSLQANQRGITTDTVLERGLLTLRFDEDDGNSTTLIIGRTAEQNERVSFVVARPADLWFHVRDFPGSHVILRGQGSSWKPTKQHMQLAADCACYFSKGRGKSAQMAVTFTAAKNVSKVKGAPTGSVEVASPQTTLVEKIMQERRKLNNKKKHRPNETTPSSALSETLQKTTEPQKTG